MKKIAVFILLLSLNLLVLCSTYSVKTHIKDNSAILKFKNTGIIFRISKNYNITEEELVRNLRYWLSVHKQMKNITIISNAADSITEFKSTQERFYQLSNENTYLKYKSLGVINIYLQDNRDELRSIITKNDLDSLIIFEVFTVISTEFQYIEFESVLAAMDSDLDIVYLDHQADDFKSESSFLNDLKNQLADMINLRLVDNMQNLNLVGGLTEGRNIAANSRNEKQAIRPAENTQKKPENTSVKEPEKPKETDQKSGNSSPSADKPEETEKQPAASPEIITPEK